MRFSSLNWVQKSRCFLLIFILFISSTIFITEQTAGLNQPSNVIQYHTSNNGNSTPDYWPTDGWRNSTPEAEGMDPGILSDMLDYIEEQDYPIDSVFIVKNGYVVFEEYPTGVYDADRKHEMHSVTKSFTSTLIGIALQQGLLGSVDELLLDFFPEYTPQNPDPRKSEITLEHLLTMTAGFEWDESTLPYLDPNVNDIGGIIASDDGVQFVLDKPMIHDPGEYWWYSGGVSLLIGAIVQQISTQSTKAFAEDFLFEPLGIESVRWFRVPGGWYNSFGGQFMITPKDMAKLGFLYLNNGMWNDTQIIPETYVRNATQPHFTDLPFPPDYAGYGWQWWLLPDLETFAALGRAGQKIIVSREHDLVAVFTASVRDGSYDPEFDLYFSYILESISPSEHFVPTESLAPMVIGVLLCIGVSPIIASVAYYFKKVKS